jgi:hypothetical protein
VSRLHPFDDDDDEELDELADAEALADELVFFDGDDVLTGDARGDDDEE